MKKTFCYMFSDNCFYKKASVFLIYVVLLVYCSIFSFTGRDGTISLELYNYFILLIVVLFGYSIFAGYKIAVIKSLCGENGNLPVLPMLNIKKDYCIGIKYLIALLMFNLPFLFLIGVFGFVYGFASVLGMSGSLINTSVVLLILSIFVYIIYLTCFLPASILVYAKTNSIWSFYKFEEVFNIAFTNKKEYIKSALLYFIFGIITSECYRICLDLSNKPLFLFFIVLLMSASVITYSTLVMSRAVANVNNDI